MLNHPDRLGYYLVNGQKFHNKPLALIESSRTHDPAQWIFNDSVYGMFDWQLPINESLTSIYRRRAEQLREQYDYLVLYYSGGADSGNILYTFVSNDIFLDEIVLQLPEPTRPTFNPTDLSMGNIYAELEYAAVPYLKQLQDRINPNTRIRYQDFAQPAFELLEHDDWFNSNPTGTNFCISGVARQYAQMTDAHVLNLCSQQKTVAQIVGVDKPLVGFDGENYYAYFLDVNAMHCPPNDPTHKELFNQLYHTEFFYWTPNMPEIVIKQAQELKNYYENTPNGRMVAGSVPITHIEKIKHIIHPVIYPPETEVNWSTEKPSFKLLRPMDAWFWSLASDRAKGNYLAVIDYFKDNIDDWNFINNNISNGFQGHASRRYIL